MMVSCQSKCSLFAADPDGTLYKDAIVRLYPPGQPLPFHSLSQGDVVLMSKGSRPGENSIEAVVVDFAARWLRVAVPANIANSIGVRTSCPLRSYFLLYPVLCNGLHIHCEPCHLLKATSAA